MGLIEKDRRLCPPAEAELDPMAALAEALDELERRVQQRTAELAAANAGLRAANEELRRQSYLLDNISDAVVATDEHERITFFNRTAEKMYGHRAEQVLGRPARDVLLAEYPGSSFEQVQGELLAQGSWRGEAEVTCADGSRILVDSTGVLLRDAAGRVTGFVSVNRDITERERIEALLRESEERYRALVDNTPDLIYSLDPEGRYTGVNRAVCESLGLAASEIIGKHYRELGVPETVVLERPATKQRVFSGEVVREETTVALPDGRLRAYEVQLYGVRDGQGRITGMRGVSRDITKRKAAETRAQEAAAQREAALNDLSASREQLQALSRNLVEALENERRTIARELHDEAGQSLTALLLGLGRLRREVDDPALVAEHIGELERLTDGVMDELHRLAMNLRPASLDRYGLVPAVTQYLESFERQTGLEVKIVTFGVEQRRLPAAVETTLYRVVQESLTNVARHARASRACVALERLNGHVLAIIEDDGLGFDVEEALRCGRLGLLGMRERAEMLGGTLSIESAPGHGTTVFIRLPCQS